MRLFDDWQLLVMVIGILGIVALFKLLKWENRQSRLEGRIDSLREEINTFREINESLRVRLKELEINKKVSDDNGKSVE